jgi:hypothetical protein
MRQWQSTLACPSVLLFATLLFVLTGFLTGLRDSPETERDELSSSPAVVADCYPSGSALGV